MGARSVHHVACILPSISSSSGWFDGANYLSPAQSSCYMSKHRKAEPELEAPPTLHTMLTRCSHHGSLYKGGRMTIKVADQIVACGLSQSTGSCSPYVISLQGANHIRMTKNTSTELITGCTAYAQLRLLTLHALAAAVLRRSRPAHL